MSDSKSLSAAEREKVAGSAISLSLVAALLCLLLFAWLAEEVLDKETLQFDNFVRATVHSWASPPLTSLMRTMSWIGSVKVMMVLVAICIAAFLYAKWKRAAFLLVITVAGAVPLDALLKVAFHRPRPVPFFGTPLPTDYSFPSGHALFSFCIFGVLAETTTARVRPVWLRIGIWILAAGLIVLIGLSRIYLGVHYPSDVIAGYLAAAIWVSSIAFVDRWRRRRAQARMVDR
jgi:undecaprenyl-diphosphatase